METADNYFQTGMNWIDRMPIEFWAVVLGLVLSLLLTQFLKRMLPIEIWTDAKHSERNYRLTIQAIAFFSGAITTFVAWPTPGAFRILVAIAVGLATPIFYFVAVRVARKIWANVEARLSGNPDP
jgi:RsiW-degrading membrane proteinase PrsW (M82 family)